METAPNEVTKTAVCFGGLVFDPQRLVAVKERDGDKNKGDREPRVVDIWLAGIDTKFTLPGDCRPQFWRWLAGYWSAKELEAMARGFPETP